MGDLRSLLIERHEGQPVVRNRQSDMQAIGEVCPIYQMSRMGEDLASDLKLHVDDIGHIQFADVPERGEPGSGKLPFPAIWKQVEASSSSGYVAAEYRPTTNTQDSLGWMKDL